MTEMTEMTEMTKTKRKSKKRTKRIIRIIALSLAAVLTAGIITVAILLHGRIASILSVRQVAEEFYTMNFRQDYHLDKALAADIRSKNDLMKFICDDMFFGYQMESGPIRYACSAFSTQTPDGKPLVGRNLDFDSIETLSIYTHPEGSYASIASADVSIAGIGKYAGVPFSSTKGKIALLASPYLCVDGMNEKGLSVSILDLDMGELHQDTGKPGLFMLVAVRLLLDRAADVEEAVALLRQYDIQTGHGWTQHLFIADARGSSVVVEWEKEKMNVVESRACTNFALSEKSALEDPSENCERFDTITKWLKNKPENSAEDSMELLQAVCVGFTQWSCVFHLDDFSVDYAIDLDYDNIYTLRPDDY